MERAYCENLLKRHTNDDRECKQLARLFKMKSRKEIRDSTVLRVINDAGTEFIRIWTDSTRFMMKHDCFEMHWWEMVYVNTFCKPKDNTYIIKITDCGSHMKINLMRRKYNKDGLENIQKRLKKALKTAWYEWNEDIFQPLLRERKIVTDDDIENGLEFFPITNVNMSRLDCFVWIGCKFQNDANDYKLNKWHARNMQILEEDKKYQKPPIFIGPGLMPGARKAAKYNHDAQEFRTVHQLPSYQYQHEHSQNYEQQMRKFQ